MHRFAGGIADRSPVPPTFPGAPVDPDDPASLGITDAGRNQSTELLLLLGQPTARVRLSRLAHRNPHRRSVLRRWLESAPSWWGHFELTRPGLSAEDLMYQYHHFRYGEGVR